MVRFPQSSTLFPYTTLFRSDAGDVLESDTAVLLGEQARARFAEAHGTAGAALHLAQEEDIDTDQHEHRQPAHEDARSEEHTSELQSHSDLVCRLLLEKKN